MNNAGQDHLAPGRACIMEMTSYSLGIKDYHF